MDFEKAKECLDTAINITDKKLVIAKAERDKENYTDSYKTLLDIIKYLDDLKNLEGFLEKDGRATVLSTFKEYEEKKD